MQPTEALPEPLSSSQPQPLAFQDYFRAIAIAAFWAIFLLTLLNRGAVEIESRIVVTAAIYLCWCPQSSCLGPLGPVPARPSQRPAFCWGLIVQLLFQALFLPGITPSHPAWSVAAMFTQTAPTATISLTPADDRLGLLSAALPFGAFIAGLVIFDTNERAAKALQWFAIGGGWLALWSIMQFLFFLKCSASFRNAFILTV